MIKAIVLGLMLAVSANVSAEEWNRSKYIAECRSEGYNAGNAHSVVNALCNCASQMVSYISTDGDSRYEDFTIDSDNPAVNGALQSCLTMAESKPYQFMLYFGTQEAGNDASVR